jgi:hypothetical protein
LKNPSQKRAVGTAQGVGPEFKPQYHKKTKNVLDFKFLRNKLSLKSIIRVGVVAQTYIPSYSVGRD